ncbi:MAG: hypothetical protein COB13_007545 [OCS116 cluster bacterium]|uniref:SnoaL-like domain-containing protein n=1 Tax=OCS116 cluster bacterium TaxID=2030921 RepID=A0A2A4Z6L1_9PROT|nr:hypothetical protein [OCS116 cluster bacterium]
MTMIDPKLEIINIVFKNMHSDVKLSTCSELYAENFIFQSPMRKAISFEEHCLHLSAICSYGELELIGITKQENCYTCEILLIIIDLNERPDEKFVANIEFHFKHNLIEKMILNYEASPRLMDYIQRNFSSE